MSPSRGPGAGQFNKLCFDMTYENGSSNVYQGRTTRIIGTLKHRKRESKGKIIWSRAIPTQVFYSQRKHAYAKAHFVKKLPNSQHSDTAMWRNAALQQVMISSHQYLFTFELLILCLSSLAAQRRNRTEPKTGAGNLFRAWAGWEAWRLSSNVYQGRNTRISEAPKHGKWDSKGKIIWFPAPSNFFLNDNTPMPKRILSRIC